MGEEVRIMSMTLEEAIREYKVVLELSTPLPIVLSKQATQLGIEALELIRDVRQQKTGYLNPLPSYLLPSEKENCGQSDEQSATNSPSP